MICYKPRSCLYYHLLTHAEVSRVIGIFYIYPVFVVPLSAVFLHEQLPFAKYGAIMLAVIGAFFLSIEKGAERWRLTHALWLMLATAALIAVIDVADKYLLGPLQPLHVYALIIIPSALLQLLLLLRADVRKDFAATARAAPLIALSVLVGFAGTIAFLLAASSAPIVIVSALGTLQPVYLFLFTIVLSLAKPQILKEILAQHALVTKAAGLLCIIAAAAVLGI